MFPARPKLLNPLQSSRETIGWYGPLYSLKEIVKFAGVGVAYRKSGEPVPTSTVPKILRSRIYTGDLDFDGAALLARGVTLKHHAYCRRQVGSGPIMRLPPGPKMFLYPSGAYECQIPSRAFIPFRVSSERLSIWFLAINTLIPCMNFSFDRDSEERTRFSFTRD